MSFNSQNPFEPQSLPPMPSVENVDELRDESVVTVDSMEEDLSDKDDLRVKMLNKLDWRLHDVSSFISLEVDCFRDEPESTSELTGVPVDSGVPSDLLTRVVIITSRKSLTERRPVDVNREYVSSVRDYK